MGELIQFPGRGQVPEVIDDKLSNMLGSVRVSLGAEQPSNDVITSPVAEGYDPLYLPNGAVKLGEGKDDFKQRFSNVGVLLYTRYFTWRRELEVARSADGQFHTDLLEVADKVQAAERLPKPRDIHDVETDVIGRFAATLTINNLDKIGLPGFKPKAVRSVAQRGLHARDETPDSQKQTALSHLAELLTPEQQHMVSSALARLVERRKVVVLKKPQSVNQ